MIVFLPTDGVMLLLLALLLLTVRFVPAGARSSQTRARRPPRSYSPFSSRSRRSTRFTIVRNCRPAPTARAPTARRPCRSSTRSSSTCSMRRIPSAVTPLPLQCGNSTRPPSSPNRDPCGTFSRSRSHPSPKTRPSFFGASRAAPPDFSPPSAQRDCSSR